MTATYQFLWIDDDKTREDFKDSLQAARFPGLKRAQLTFTNVKKLDSGVVLSELEKGTEPDLVLMDQFIDTKGVIRQGYSFTEILREKWNRCPIVGVTAARRRDDIDLDKQEQYEDIVSVEDLRQNYYTLFTLAESHRRLAKKTLRTADSLLKLLKAPKDELDRLQTALPQSLKNDFTDTSYPRRLSRWIRHTLQGRPGFLYDRAWAATHLGLNEKGFEKVERQFLGALYSGIFRTKDLWWSSTLRSILFQATGAQKSKLPWQLGGSLKGITESHLSKCHCCSKLYPETLGYEDLGAKARLVPLHLSCSKPHPKYDSSLFFDEIRVMECD